MSSHSVQVFHNLESLLKEQLKDFEKDSSDYIKVKRYWERRWRDSKSSSNNPLVLRCSICSGEKHKRMVKAGEWKVSTREEKKLLREELEERE